MKFFPAQFYPTFPYKTAQLTCTRFFINHKFLANLNSFTSNDRANNFTSDSEKLIAVCYSQQKLYLHIVNTGKTAHFLLNFTLNKIKLAHIIMNNRVYFVRNTCYFDVQ